MLTVGIVFVGMRLLKYLPVSIVDRIVVFLSKLRYRGMSENYGIQRPKEGPFFLKEKTGRTPTIDVGAMERIKTGEIKVSITCMVSSQNLSPSKNVHNGTDETEISSTA